MENKTALIVGSSGLTGSFCLTELLINNDYREVETWVRRPSGIKHPKLKEIIVDFSTPENLPQQLPDHVFCCLGTTIKKAGSQDAFTKVDLDLVALIAGRAERSGSEKFLVVSSIGANKDSGNFYLKTKGLMEEKVTSFRIPSILIFRPSMLLGKRNEFRFGEVIGKGVMKAIGFFLVGKLRKYRGIEASKVARAMIRMASQDSRGVIILESDKISSL